MTIKVIVQPAQQTVVIKANGQGALQANAVTVGVSVGGSGGATRLKDLVDVNTSNAQNGDVLVYQSNNQSFTTSPVDGGSF